MGLIKKPFLFRKKGKTDQYDPDTDYCGVWPFKDRDSEFNPACYWHDCQYDYAAEHPGELSLADVDNGLLQRMNILAGNNKRLQRKAKLFYCLAHAWGLTVRRSLFK